MKQQTLLVPLLFFALLSGVVHGAQTCTPTEGSPSASSETVSLRAVGDVVLGNNWPSGGWPAGYEKAAPQQLKRVLGQADTIFGNFEGTLTTYQHSNKVPRGTSVFAFRMPPHFATLLRDAGFDVIAVANN
ncbi:MAG: CapA family protein, partial [Gammaproteobacteria bacterium]|nr:CapA family protein [Gammaproteobacteria bacterium]